MHHMQGHLATTKYAHLIVQCDPCVSINVYVTCATQVTIFNLYDKSTEEVAHASHAGAFLGYE